MSSSSKWNIEKEKIASIILLVSLLAFSPALAESEQHEPTEELEIHYFYQDGCPYCAQQEEFHDELKEEFSELKIHEYDIEDSDSNQELEYLSEKYDVSIERPGVPMTFVGGEFFQGFSTHTAENIEAALDGKQVQESGQIDVPLIGSLNPSEFSLPLLAIVLGLIDGLNVCSIGALILILTIVMKFDSRPKILFFGGLFILTTVTVYGLIIFAWYGLFELFITRLGIARILIGLTALMGAIIFFKQFLEFYKHGPTCKTTTNQYVGKIVDRIKDHVTSGSLALVALAIVIFSVLITLVELPCSIALPMVFAGVLSESSLPTVVYSFYIVLYLLFYMLIELIIFFVAVFTKDIWYGPDKAVTWTTLLASLILLGLAIYYLNPLFVL